VSLLPVAKSQAGDPAELAGVVGDERGIVGAGNGGNHQIIGTDGCALGGELGADESVFLGATVVEGQAEQRSEEAIEQRQIGSTRVL